LKILYFAQLKDLIGKSEESIILENEISIKELINILKKRDSNYKTAFEKIPNLKFAVNCEYVSLNKLVRDNDEIAFFPPVTGG
tara:strand:- start:1130 stop:1378 length:249 start_codon:yes stop_codon:yes gene_type:complete